MAVQCVSSAEYVPLYGGVVAQSVHSTSTGDPDVIAAVELAAKQAKFTGVQYSVANIEKQRLYFTLDGVSPYLHQRQHRDASGKVTVQQTQVVMGLLYSFTIMPVSSDTGVHFTVTRDRNKEYHIFRQVPVLPTPSVSNHTWAEEMNKAYTCSNLHPHAQPLSLLFLPQSLGSSSAQSLRVASYNIWNVNSLPGTGEDYETRLSRLTKFIISLDVDVFGFQEVRLEVGNPGSAKSHKKRQRKTSASTRTLSQVSDLARGLPGYHFVYQPAMLYMEKFQERKEEGLAVFSRYPIVTSHYKLLFKNRSDTEDTHQRICLHAVVLVPHVGLVHIFVSHLSLSVTAQERSVVEIWEFMQHYSGIKLLMGDMNAEPDSKTIRFLTGEVPIGGTWTSGLHDSWTLPSFNSNNAGLTFNALEDMLVKRIDYIFMNFGSSSTGIHITTSEVVHDDVICNPPCSDHHLLLTVLSPA